MNRNLLSALLATLWIGACTEAVAQLDLIEFHQEQLPYNLQSERGAPIGTVVGTPPGSDGRMTLENESVGSAFLPSDKQFQSIVPFGGTLGLTPANQQAVKNSQILQDGSTPFSELVVNEMKLPAARDSRGVVMVLRRAQVGVPYVSRLSTVSFGSVIDPPVTDENGIILTDISPSAYWLPEPYTANNHDGEGYYWSPHAGRVYAIQSGPISMQWIKAEYTTEEPPDFQDNQENWFRNGEAYFRLFETSYVVSGTPVKKARKMYWTERDSRDLGKPISIPSAAVGELNIVYSPSFPRTVAEEFIPPGSTSITDGTTNTPLPELRTLWHDRTQGNLYAYNKEGRVFVELLGDLRSDGQSREQLGFEIVEVFKAPSRVDVTVDLGEQIIPPPPILLEEVSPEPVLQLGTSEFAYQHNLAGTTEFELWAIGETENINDYLVHWMEEGEVGLKWPAVLGRYQLVWPTDEDKYSHYVRPSVANVDEAKLTAVAMPTDNVPTIQYQDIDPEYGTRAALTPTFGFYTFLDPSFPMHRTLLQFSSGGNIAFERVFSWLDVNMKYRSAINENLKYQQYIDYVEKRTRGVNGEWELIIGNEGNINPEAEGEIGSWSIVVESQAEGGGQTYTNEFGSGSMSWDAPGFDTETLTVRGITNAVTAVKLKVNDLNTSDSSALFIFIESPIGGNYALRKTGVAIPAVDVDLVFDDRALDRIQSVTSGTYRFAEPLDILPAIDEVPRPEEPFVTERPDDLPSDGPGAPAWADVYSPPRVIYQTVDVGQRIIAPRGELGAPVGSEYLAGYIHQPSGTSFNVNAYSDPFLEGFDMANLGSIIPVNAIPGSNHLEVWWFRSNGADITKGFSPVFWPSVIGHYDLQWPNDPREIVLASNQGSETEGPLSSLQAKGNIYHQNTPGEPGYNPNEEHAIISGGTVFATRDDLNITTGDEYSSDRFALLEYIDQDGRPSMSVFKVLREKPEAGWVFDYIVEAGRLLQPPMPLPLLAKPLEGSGDNIVNYNTEPIGVDGDLPGGWDEDRDASGAFGHYKNFTYRDRKNDFWVYRGQHSGLPDLETGTYDIDNQSFDALTTATAVVDQPFEFVIHASRQDEFLNVREDPSHPTWLSAEGLTLRGTPASTDVGTTTLELVVYDPYLEAATTNQLELTVADSGSVLTQPRLVLSSTNDYTGSIVSFSDRPPFLAESPEPGNSFTMRYYYKTEPDFAWPGIANPPEPGAIVPYLRPLDAGDYVGDATSKNTESLNIVYRPVWPERDPKDSSKGVGKMKYGVTLANPFDGLPGVRDWRTAQVLYQQSIGTDINSADASVVLHDPTREKVSDLAAQSLNGLPPSVNSQIYQGKYYFPNLPPHLANRVFFDANRGENGSLVLVGEFKEATFGEDYMNLNVLRGTDLNAVRDLCPPADTDNSPKWIALVNALSTPMETFYENPSIPGTFIANPSLTTAVGVQNLAEVGNDSIAVDSYALSASGPGSGYVTLVEAGGRPFTQPGDPVALHVIRVVPELHAGEIKVLPSENPLSEQVTFRHTPDLAGRFSEYFYEWKIAAPVDGQPPARDDEMSRYQALVSGTDHPIYLLSGSGIRVLGDNWLVLRYKSANTSHPLYDQWSDWTKPQLAEGWIKRVLAGINPFNQRIRDLFNNRVNTDASILTQAGGRWEGDIALNLDTINNYGLIEIYETILRRGRSISIESGFNYGPANDALLLAAGYLNDLYMMIGNEAWADAANPTIGIGTANNTYGDIATSLFAFRGQLPSLLEEELALLRGRDDFLVPGVETAPIYNRMVWNYTRGIDAGEVVYALNYNIQENPDLAPDGVIDATDAAIMFPQGHGDAYGHYLTALKGYYSLFINSNFDWVPRSEAVLVAGQPVSVDYQDERKFAAAAAALGRTTRQVFDLTWRRDHQAVKSAGWEHFGETRENSQRQYDDGGNSINSIRHWGLDHWASRAAQGNYINWIMGNAILPDEDPDPTHEGIQKIDRTTVPELQELTVIATELQTAMDGAEAGSTPLGLSENAIAFDLNPNVIVGPENGTHFEQVYERAKVALNNAVVSFDDAKDVTRLMRSEQDSLADLQNSVAKQELAYENALIELYGTPYPDDIGPGKTWKQGYTGPDLIHYMYAELPETEFPGLWNNLGDVSEFRIDIQDFPEDWATDYSLTDLEVIASSEDDYSDGTGDDTNTVHYISFNIGPHGFSDKPQHWTGRRASPGQLQRAISRVISTHTALRQALFEHDGTKVGLDRAIGLFDARVDDHATIRGYREDLLIAEQTLEAVQVASKVASKVIEAIKDGIDDSTKAAVQALPRNFIAGTASGGDLTSPGRAALEAIGEAAKRPLEIGDEIQWGVVKALELATSASKRWVAFNDIAPLEWDEELRSAMAELGDEFENLQALLGTINARQRDYSDATSAYRALLSKGDRIQQERLVFRQRAAAVVQGYRTRDAAFRIFRNEKLERYKTLFDLAAKYSFLAANAYDYETGLLGDTAGQNFVNRIIGARALGVVQGGEPQFAGSNTGDPGLSSALAEMKSDWDVVRGRLGFNNPDAYGTTTSLRTENFRILGSAESDPNWKDILLQHRVPNLLADSDVRRYCLEIERDDNLAVPGILIEFTTTIANGYNLFGRQLAAGDHGFSPASFATKIFGVGVALDGYQGMDEPAANGGIGGSSPSDPDLWFLDTDALTATPYVYLIPVGIDSMRIPPIGESSGVRTWTVNDVAIPLPFNIGGTEFASGGLFASSGTLTEPLFDIRRHQPFRPVPDGSYFNTSLYGATGTLTRSQYTNNRLVGRSVWNSRWKLVIPGHALLNDPDEGLNRFINTVRDIKLHFVTYSYSGN